jgi:diguanylate cyclase (GGDEF)-like protein
MRLQRLLRAGTSIEVTILALISVVRAAGCLLTIAAPMTDDTPVQTILAVAATSAALATTLVLMGPRLRTARLHPFVAIQIALITVLTAVSATERGMMVASLGFIWTAIYVAIFFSPHAARNYAVALTVGLAISMVFAHVPTDVTVWLMLSAMVWMSIAILSKLNQRLRALAHTDGLTGLLNRTGFALAAARQRALAQRLGLPVSLAVIDLDDFKGVNDRGGHAAGDRLLVELASAWSASLRPSDVLARHGGDEFVLLLPGVSEAQAKRLLVRLADAHPGAWTAGVVPCTTTTTLDQAIASADERLYAAKAARRGARFVSADTRTALAAGV